MFILIAFFIVVPAAAALAGVPLRALAVISLVAAAGIWSAIARTAYHSAIPMNEPEWWGGLAVVSVLVIVGLAIGGFLRHRLAPSQTE